MAELFEQVAGQVAILGTRGAWLRDRLLLAIDGFEVDVADTKENAVEFGYAWEKEGRSVFPSPRRRPPPRAAAKLLVSNWPF
ncbi:hypothetical protein [Pseudofrankia asymbiotica]|uniref:Uncharacterized protein n=1 Tax=Pseudofrankia asymbiotica TaxID=1834516 RepID=A0A1V2I0Q1_9ACTN|nr:hypothetical protein [Pseudofrankia asymbiotica]ONH22796.1 hypothetical protein BL253_34670 [Pseudofrankia asymbiotica]